MSTISRWAKEAGELAQSELVDDLPLFAVGLSLVYVAARHMRVDVPDWVAVASAVYLAIALVGVVFDVWGEAS